MSECRPIPLTLKLLAAVGEAVVILAFAAIGRSSHDAHDGGQVLGTLGTAAPFLIGWFLSALTTGAYRDEAFRSQRSGALSIVRSWPAGCLLGCGIRSALERHLTPLSFVAIAFTFNLLFLTAWRTALTALFLRREPLEENR